MSSGIGKGFVNVVPSDTVDIAKNAQARFPDVLRFGTGGTAVIVGADGTVATFLNIADGESIPCTGRRVNATGLTAGSIIGIYL